MTAWKLYNDILEQIPPVPVFRMVTHHVAFVESEMGAGIASIPGEPRGLDTHSELAGSNLREIAQLVTSWNPIESALAVAAINSCVNTQASIDAYSAKMGPKEYIASSTSSIFSEAPRLTTGKKTAMIGHFHSQLDHFAGTDLTIIERSPEAGDLPDPACEYVLPESDVVIITGMTFTNKTLPRLLELSQQALTILVGPSVPFVPEIFRKQVDILAPTLVDNPELAVDLITNGTRMRNLRPAVSRFVVDLRAPQSSPRLSWQQ